MVTRVDLRVHTTAPSSRFDDERYKAQAEAYTSFIAAATSTKVVSHGHGSSTKGDGLPPPPSSHDDVFRTNMMPEMQNIPSQHFGEPADMDYDPTTFLEETQLGYTALESQIFAPSSRSPRKLLKRPAKPLEDDSVIHGPPVSERTGHNASNQDESSSSHRIPSQSSYLRSPVLDRSIKKPRINEGNRQFFKPSGSLLPPFTYVQGNGDPTVRPLSTAVQPEKLLLGSQQHSSRLEDLPLSGDDVTSELPTSYSLSDVTSGSSKSKQQSIQRSVSDPGPSPLGPTGAESVEQRQSEGLPQSPPSHDSQASNEAEPSHRLACENSLKVSNSGTVVKDFANAETAANDAILIANDSPISSSHLDLPTSIRAPAPQPSLQRFVTHITESLKYLSDNANLAQCYKPIFVSRDVEQSERGCWTFDITSWPAQLRTDFFLFLAKMIEPGRVGWGIWCVREPSALEVQVFCWGEVVRHVYLMLYVASKSKVRKLGLRWIDAEGEVVVQMRGVQ